MQTVRLWKAYTNHYCVHCHSATNGTFPPQGPESNFSSEDFNLPKVPPLGVVPS